ncbi:hypothetical protein PSAT104721_06985 [Pseudoalteromonas atlantica]
MILDFCLAAIIIFKEFKQVMQNHIDKVISSNLQKKPSN